MARGRELRLRPLGLTDVLDETVELFRSNFWLLVGITAIVEIPINLLNPSKNTSALMNDKFDPTAFGGYMVALVAWFFLYLVVVMPIQIGALTGAISERYLSRQTTIVDSYKRVLRWRTLKGLISANFLIGFAALVWYALIVTILIFGLGGFGAMGGFDSIGPSIAVVIGAIILFMAAMVPLVWFLLATSLTPAGVTLEGLSAWQAVKRSLALTKGMIWSILGAYLIVTLVVGIIQSVLIFPLQAALIPSMMSKGAEGAFQMPFWINMVAAITGAALAPLARIVIVLFYYDARVRKEGFDLVMLAEQLDSGGGPRVAFGETSHPQERDESWRVADMDHAAHAEKAQSFELGQPESDQREWGTQPPSQTPAAPTPAPAEEPAPSAEPLQSEPEQPTEKPKDEPV